MNMIEQMTRCLSELVTCPSEEREDRLSEILSFFINDANIEVPGLESGTRLVSVEHYLRKHIIARADEDANFRLSITDIETGKMTSMRTEDFEPFFITRYSYTETWTNDDRSISSIYRNNQEVIIQKRHGDMVFEPIESDGQILWECYLGDVRLDTKTILKKPSKTYQAVAQSSDSRPTKQRV